MFRDARRSPSVPKLCAGSGKRSGSGSARSCKDTGLLSLPGTWAQAVALSPACLPVLQHGLSVLGSPSSRPNAHSAQSVVAVLPESRGARCLVREVLKPAQLITKKMGVFPQDITELLSRACWGLMSCLSAPPIVGYHPFRGIKLGLKSWFSSLRAHLCDPGCGRSSEPASVPPRKHSHILTNILPPGLSALMAKLPLSLGPL